MTLTKKTTHATEALDRLVEQFKGKLNLQYLINAYTAQTQEDENAFWELFTQRALDTAVGDQLDGIGSIVGESRNGRSDADYLLGIKAQIKLNTMSGTADEILEVIALLTANVHTLIEYFPAGLVIVFDDQLDADADELASNLDCAAGVRGTIEYTEYDDDYTFTFADADVDQASTTHGFVSEVLAFTAGLSYGPQTHMESTEDGVSYSLVTGPKAFGIFGLAYRDDGPLVLGVGAADGVDAYIIKSVDGVSWSEVANPKNLKLNRVCWSPDLSLWAACGEPDTDAYIVTSPDAVTFTERANSFNGALNAITWAGGSIQAFVAVGDKLGTRAYIVTSTDGTTWATRLNPKNFDLYGVAYSPALGLLVACGEADGTDAYMLKSTDGTTWTEVANPHNLDLAAVAWSPELALFCAVGQGSSNRYIVTSEDGDTWTSRTNPKSVGLYDVCWSADLGLFIACGNFDGGDAYLITSPDGISWTERSTNNAFPLNSVVPLDSEGGYLADAILI